MSFIQGLLYKVTWPFDHVVLQGHVINESHYPLYLHCYYISIATKLHRIVNLPWWAPIDIPTWPFDHVVLLDHITNWKHCISTTTIPMATKPDNVVAYHEEHPLKKLNYTSFTWFCEVKWHNQILNIPTWTKPIIPKHRKVVTLCEGLPPVNSHNHLNMCSHEVTWQIKNTVSPLSKWLCSQDLLRGAPTHIFA